MWGFSSLEVVEEALDCSVGRRGPDCPSINLDFAE
jgi:hypothetical protein